MKKLLLLTFAFCSFAAQGQQEKEEPLPEGWYSTGKFQLLFNQSAFNEEWSGGGTSSAAGNLTLDYQLHYKKNEFTWDNRFIANYGLTKLKGDQYTRKTSDRLEFNSIAGKQINESNWHYSFFTNFRTQFTSGYEYLPHSDSSSETRVETSHFFSPAYLQIGPGMLWKDSDKLWVNLAPATSRFIFVDRDFTNAPTYSDGSYYGVDAGETMRYELGASVTGFFATEVVTNVLLQNSLSLYSNYLDQPGNVDIDYLMNLDMKINDFLSANFVFQAIYDDNTVAAFQIREVFGAGLNYSF